MKKSKSAVPVLKKQPLVSVIMGSDSDLHIMQDAVDILIEF